MVTGCFLSACISQPLSGTNNQNSLCPTEEIPLSPLPTSYSNNTNNNSLEIQSGTGTILYNNVEGGFFGIVTDDGNQYLPVSIPEDYKKNGTHVSFTFRPIHDSVTIFMWGSQVEIMSITNISDNLSIRSHDPIIEYELAGGITGAYEVLSLYGNNSGDVSKWNQIKHFILPEEKMLNIKTLFENTKFTSFNNADSSINSAPDAVTHTIRYQNKTVRFTDGKVPEQIRPVVEILSVLLEKNTISPITANISLEGTVWNLASYLRPDGIMISIGNTSSISAIFGKDRLTTGSTGCNSYSVEYNHTGTNLSFGQIAVTRMACLDASSAEIENEFLRLLQEVKIVSGEERILTMSNQNTTPILIFNLIKS